MEFKSLNNWKVLVLATSQRLAEAAIFIRKKSICQHAVCTKLAAMQKSSIPLSIDQWRLSFRPLAYCLQQRSCEMTRHVMWPHPGQHLWASSESALPDKWVCGDEQLMEWPAKVMMLGEAPFCSLISIWTNTHLLQMPDNLGQRSSGWNPNSSFGSGSSFSISLSSKATCWFKQHWLKKGRHLIYWTVCLPN